jgi:hypothetical protein
MLHPARVNEALSVEIDAIADVERVSRIGAFLESDWLGANR